MQSETGFPSSHQLKSYVAYKSRLKLAARGVLSADAGLLVKFQSTLGSSALPKRGSELKKTRNLQAYLLSISKKIRTHLLQRSRT